MSAAPERLRRPRRNQPHSARARATSDVASARPSALAGKNLAGGDDYRCRFSAPTLTTSNATVPATYVSSGPWLRCITPALESTSWVMLTVTLNGQQYAQSALNFSLYGQIWLLSNASVANVTTQALSGLSLYPPIGPTVGNTTVQVFGVLLSGGSAYRCRWHVPLGDGYEIRHTPAELLNVTVVYARFHPYLLQINASLPAWLAPSQPDVLTCPTPELNASSAPSSGARLEISVNGQQFHTSAELEARYYPPAVLAQVSPLTGPTTGDTRVLIAFANGTAPTDASFAAVGGLLCRFDEVAVPALATDGGSELECTSPPVDSLDVGLER